MVPRALLLWLACDASHVLAEALPRISVENGRFVDPGVSSCWWDCGSGADGNEQQQYTKHGGLTYVCMHACMYGIACMYDK